MADSAIDEFDIQNVNGARYRSAVWKYFGFVVETKNDEKKVNYKLTACKHCRKISSYTGNTTNMTTHMYRHHPNIDSGTTSKQAKASTSTTKADKLSFNSSNTTTTGQLRLQESFNLRFSPTSMKAIAITKSIGAFIALDMRPYTIVESPAFRHMINTIEPRYQVPSSSHFAEKIVPELYNEAKSKVQDQLKKAFSVSITTDGWTSRATQSYITVTGHFIDPDWVMRSYVLQTRILEASHTGR